MKIFNLEIREFFAIKVRPAYKRKVGVKNLAASEMYLGMGLCNLLGKGRTGIVDPEKLSQSCIFMRNLWSIHRSTVDGKCCRIAELRGLWWKPAV